MRIILILLTLLVVLTACPPIPINSPTEPEYSKYYPILIDREDANSKIKVSNPREVTKAGKFYKYGDYLLLVEEGQGIHVYDNSNIYDPKNIAFIELRNITDVAISENVLFVNQSVDLVALNVTNFNNVIITSRIPDISTDITPDGLPLEEKYIDGRPENLIVDRWELIDDNGN